MYLNYRYLKLYSILLSPCYVVLSCHSPEEAGRYLETYKAFESKPPDLIKEKTDSDFLSKVGPIVLRLLKKKFCKYSVP